MPRTLATPRPAAAMLASGDSNDCVCLSKACVGQESQKDQGSCSSATTLVREELGCNKTNKFTTKRSWVVLGKAGLARASVPLYLIRRNEPVEKWQQSLRRLQQGAQHRFQMQIGGPPQTLRLGAIQRNPRPSRRHAILGVGKVCKWRAPSNHSAP